MIPCALSLRLRSLLAACLLVAGTLATAWHGARDAHAVCAEHGIVEHGAPHGGHAHTAPGSDVELAPRDSAGHAHEACPLALALRERPVEPARAPAVASADQLPAAGAPAANAPVLERADRLRLAPKTSPPRVG